LQSVKVTLQQYLTVIWIKQLTSNFSRQSHNYLSSDNSEKWKSCQEEMQILCASCSKAEPKIYAPLQTPFPGAWDGQNLIS